MDWAAYAASVGIAYYPKLISAVPFNPVTGSRLLTAPIYLRGALAAPASAAGVLSQLAKSAGLSSAHVLFHRLDGELGCPARTGWLLAASSGEQYHFHNAGYAPSRIT